MSTQWSVVMPRPDAPPSASAPWRVRHAVTGFDPTARAWMTAACASSGRVPLPLLDGRLLVDLPRQMAVRDDSGRPARRLIAALLLPGSVHDMVHMLRFCRRNSVRDNSGEEKKLSLTPLFSARPMQAESRRRT